MKFNSFRLSAPFYMCLEATLTVPLLETLRNRSGERWRVRRGRVRRRAAHRPRRRSSRAAPSPERRCRAASAGGGPRSRSASERVGPTPPPQTPRSRRQLAGVGGVAGRPTSLRARRLRPAWPAAAYRLAGRLARRPGQNRPSPSQACQPRARQPASWAEPPLASSSCLLQGPPRVPVARLDATAVAAAPERRALPFIPPPGDQISRRAAAEPSAAADSSRSRHSVTFDLAEALRSMPTIGPSGGCEAAVV